MATRSSTEISGSSRSIETWHDEIANGDGWHVVPLTPEGCAARRERLWKSLPEPCDALVITTPESLVYLANYEPSPFVFNTAEAAAALLLWPDRSILIGDNLLQPFLDQACVDEVVCVEWYTGKKSAPPRRGVLVQAITEQIAR